MLGIDVPQGTSARGPTINGTGREEKGEERPDFCPPPLPKQIGRVALQNWVRGFYLGYAIEVAPALLSLILRGRKSMSWSAVGRAMLRILLRGDAAGFAMFLGAYAAAFPTLKVALARVLGRPEGHPLISAVAGGLAGTAVLLDASPAGHERRTTMALNLFIRAMDFGARAAVRHGKLPHVPHMDTILFQLSCTEIMYSWLLIPETLPKAYVSWIARMAQMDERLLLLLRKFRDGSLWYGKHSDILASYCIQHGYDPRDGDPFYGFVDCHIVHPLDPTSCSGNVVRRWRNGFLASLLIYLPVHAVPALLFRFNVLRSKPFLFLTDLAFSTGRSASFLATFIALIWGMICLTRNTLKTDSVLGPFLGSFACGFSLLIERKSRRMELALYVVPRALYSAYMKLVNAGLAPVYPNFSVLLFCLSSALLLYCRDYEPESMRGSIGSLTRWFFGTPKESDARKPN